MRAYEVFVWMWTFNTAFSLLFTAGFFDGYIIQEVDSGFMNVVDRFKIDYSQPSANFSDYLLFGDLLKSIALFTVTFVYTTIFPAWYISGLGGGFSVFANFFTLAMWLIYGAGMTQWISKQGLGGME